MLNPDCFPVLVCCPSGVKYAWQREFKNHGDIESIVLNGQRPDAGLLRRPVTIINHDILHHWLPVLIKQGFKTLVPDECHKFGNRSAKRTKAIVELGKSIPHVIALSGTPITSRPIQFFPILNTIDPKTFPGFWKYAMRYCNPKPGFRGRGWNFNGVSNPQELHTKIVQIMLRRMRTEVLKDLPIKTRIVMPVDIDNRGEYDKCKENILQWLEQNKGKQAAQRASGAIAIVKLNHLRQLTAIGKLPAIVPWIDNFLDETQEKLVVFTEHRAILDKLLTIYPGAASISGGDNAMHKQQSIDTFQNNPTCRLMLCQIEAGGIGTTFTAASTVLFTEINWVPATHDQAEGRCLRIGQKANKMQAYYFVGRDTVDEKVMSILESKQNVISQIIDGRPASAAESIIQSLFLER